MKQKKKSMITDLIPQETIASKILLLRGKKVMLDRNLARLYGVTTGNLNKAVRRNLERFPEDFMFQHRKVYNVSPKPPPDLLGKSKRLGLRKSPITGDNKSSPKAIFLIMWMWLLCLWLWPSSEAKPLPCGLSEGKPLPFGLCSRRT